MFANGGSYSNSQGASCGESIGNSTGGEAGLPGILGRITRATPQVEERYL